MTTEDIRTAVRAKIAALNLQYSAAFVPFSQSRNRAERNPSLNWRVTLSARGRSIVTDYMQGIGHLPGYRYPGSQRSLAADGYTRSCAESGRYAPTPNPLNPGAGPGLARVAIPAPDVVDVLHSLVMDAGALDYASFEDWASEYGYEEDSRKAEKIYRDCLAIALELRAMIGDAALTKLRELFSDY